MVLGEKHGTNYLPYTKSLVNAGFPASFSLLFMVQKEQ